MSNKRVRTNRKGFIFTLDATLGLILLVTTIVAIGGLLITRTESPQVNYEQIHYAADDAMAVLVERGSLAEIGSLWAMSSCSTAGSAPECTEASNLARDELVRILPTRVGYRLKFGSDIVYQTNTPNPSESNASNVVVARRVASGITKGRNSTGYIARSFATKVGKRTTTRVFPVAPSGGGWKPNNFVLEKTITLPNDAVIRDATMYVALRYGNPSSPPPPGLIQQLTVNGDSYTISKDEWTYVLTDSDLSASAVLGNKTVTSSMQAGENTLHLEIKSPVRGQALVHPGTYLQVTFDSNESFFEHGVVGQTIPLDDATGDPGVWVIASYDVPPSATGVGAELHLELESVRDHPNEQALYGQSDVTIYLNSDTSLFENASPSADPTYDLDLTSATQSGTNVLAIYVNTNGVDAWDTNEVRIKPTSYVTLNYTYEPSNVFGFGEIDITAVVPWGGDPANPKQINYFIPEYANPIIEGYVHLAKGFTNRVNLSAWPMGELQSIIFNSPASRAVPSSIFLSQGTQRSNQTNYIHGVDYADNGSTESINEFLAQSVVEYTFLARIRVAYGSVFDDQDDAMQDAQDRLQELIDDLNIDLDELEIANESLTIGGIPSLWGPARFTLEVWQ